MIVKHTICDGCDADLHEQPHGTLFSAVFNAWPDGHALHDFYLCPKCLTQLSASLAAREHALRGGWEQLSRAEINRLFGEVAENWRAADEAKGGNDA